MIIQVDMENGLVSKKYSCEKEILMENPGLQLDRLQYALYNRTEYHGYHWLEIE